MTEPLDLPLSLTGGCHCGAVRFRVQVRSDEVVDCNCTVCTRKGFLHVIVPDVDFELLTPWEALATYRFNTGVAAHHFCATCGIHSFYRPRSHPDGWSVNARCLDPDPEHPTVAWHDRLTIVPFDGQNWETDIDRIR